MNTLVFVLISMILTPVKTEIFYNGAKILYSARVLLKNGYNEVVLTGLPDNSRILGISVSRTGKIVGFDRIDSMDIGDTCVNKLRALYDSLKMRYSVLSWNNRIIESEKNFLLNLLSVKNQDSLKQSPDRLSLFLDTVKKKSNALAMEGYITNRELKNIEKSMKMLSDSLKMLSHGIRVEILSRAMKTVKINVEIFSPGIFYHPEYSLNAVPEKNTVNLLALANVKNNTSMTLKNVEVTLVMQSFSYGGITNIVPERFYYDSYYHRLFERKAKGTTQLEDFENSKPEIGSRGPIVKEYATGEKIILQGRYTLRKRSSLSIKMFEDTLEANFVRRAYPRKYAGAWLYGKVKVNKYPVGLKNVRMSIDGVYQGKWHHPQRDMAFSKDTFFANFGRDERIVVKRETVKSTVSENWQGKVKRRFHYRITIKSRRLNDVKIILYDNLPLFHSDKYEIKNIEIKPEGYDLDRETGIIKWEIMVPHGGEMNFDVLYDIVSNP